jgi:hypothetical protein
MANAYVDSTSYEKEKKNFFRQLSREMRYIWGNPKRGDDVDKKHDCGRGALKIQIIGVKERFFGIIRSIATKRYERNFVFIVKQFIEFIKMVYDHTSTIISDEFSGYNVLNYHQTEFIYLMINHLLG